jgi:hypothetical protein
MTSDFDKMTADLKTIDDLGRLVIADDKGNPTLRFGYVIKLYFERAFETDVRERLLCVSACKSDPLIGVIGVQN